MEINENKYNRGKIYKIVNEDESEIYIGSTCVTLCNRLAQHKNEFKLFKEGKKISKITSFILFEKYGINNCRILLLEEYSCNTKEQLTSREGYYIKTLNCVNKRVEGRKRTYKEDKEYWEKWYEENKDKAKERITEWNKENNDKCKVYRKKCYEKNKDIVKKYQTEHKDEIKAYQKQYREKKKKERENNI
jgi:hypothetical protein